MALLLFHKLVFSGGGKNMLRPGMLKRFPVKLTRTHIVTALPSSSTRLGLLLTAEANEFLLSLIDFYHTSRSVVQDFDQHPQGIFSESFPIQEKSKPHKQGKCVSTQRFCKGVSARSNGREW